METYLKDAIQFGLTGFVLYIIVRPVFQWFMARTDARDSYIDELVRGHFERAEQRHNEMIDVLRGLPHNISQATLESLQKVYPPDQYGDKLYEKHKS